MYRKVIAAALIAMFTGMAANADTIMNTTPSDNQADLTADAGQTFKTGTLVSNELTYISIEGPQTGAVADMLYLAVYENDGSVSNWVPGTIVGVSTNAVALDVNGATRFWYFAAGTVLSDNTDYLFMFAEDADGVYATGARPGLTGGSTPDNGAVISQEQIPFGGAFDIACVISTDEPPDLLFPPTIISFAASELVVTEGGSVTLSWATTNAVSVTLDGADVTAITSTVVVVNSTTIYELIATNVDGSATNSLTVTANPPLEAGQIVTSYGTVSGGDDANQAGPMFGQGITINVGANTNDAAIPNPVSLQQVSFQISGTAVGGAAVAYLHVYDDFAVDGTASPTTIGNLIAVSTTTVDFSTASPLDTVTWQFDEDELDKATVYHYILAIDTTAATVLDSSNLTTASFELNVGNPYDGGDAWRANGTNLDWDMEFEVITADVSSAGPVSDLEITGPVSGGTAMVLSWTGEAGKPYGVETNSNLIIANWQIFETGLIGNGGILSVTNAIEPNETFYRVISE